MALSSARVDENDSSLGPRHSPAARRGLCSTQSKVQPSRTSASIRVLRFNLARRCVDTQPQYLSDRKTGRQQWRDPAKCTTCSSAVGRNQHGHRQSLQRSTYIALLALVVTPPVQYRDETDKKLIATLCDHPATLRSRGGLVASPRCRRCRSLPRHPPTRVPSRAPKASRSQRGTR